MPLKDTIRKINKNFKSRVLFSKNCSTPTKAICTLMLGIEEKHSFDKYLGFPIFHERPKNSDFHYLVDSMRQKLTGWKTKNLNMAGQTVLAKTMLSGIPSHVMGYIRLPEGVIKTLDKTTRDFIWGTTQDKDASDRLGYCHTPQGYGGLGIQKLAIRNKAILSRMAWSLSGWYKSLEIDSS